MQVLHQLPKFDDPKILVGNGHMDDAGVYAINENLAIVQSVDILTPIADDPYIFGQIVAANSISDIYAMGAKPISALSIICYPTDEIDNEVIVRILEGVGDKAREAGACIIGGHTLKDAEVKCGLAVIGLVRPDKMITNNKASPGDRLVLTKPIGTGIMSSALKANLATPEAIKKANYFMCQLNKNACDAMLETEVSSATDVTGFGLLGHALEMAEANNVSMIINALQVPLMAEVLDLAEMSLFPMGSIKNFEFVRSKVKFSQNISTELMMLLCDAQTSGGLLISVPLERSERFIDLLIQKGVKCARIIGEVIEPQKRGIYVE